MEEPTKEAEVPYLGKSQTCIQEVRGGTYLTGLSSARLTCLHVYLTFLQAAFLYIYECPNSPL